MTTAELLVAEIRTLPDDYIEEAMDFVGYLKVKAARRQTESADAPDDDSWFETGGGCPICAKHRDPVTGNPRYNAETVAAIEEGDAMLRGEIPANWHTSIDDLDEILGLAKNA
jgi:hypothetical protein